MARRRGEDLKERPLSELLRDLSQEVTSLVRHEMALARAELTEKGKQAGIGAGMFGGAAIAGLMALGALTAAMILGLALLMPGWLAALVVALLYGAAAGVLALTGKSKVSSATPPVPAQAIEEAKATKEDLTWAWQRGRQS